MNDECNNCGGKLEVKYALNLRNFVILILYLIALFFSFAIILRFSGWYGAFIFIAVAMSIGWFIRDFIEKYTECKQCKTKVPL